MAEIRAALVEAKIKVFQEKPTDSELIHLLTLSNSHSELDPMTGVEVLVVDFHSHEISFGVPIELIEKFRQIKLADKFNQFILIEGRDVNGRWQKYSLQITERMMHMLAYQIYIVLSSARGNDFAQQYFLEWENWMQ